MRDQDATVLVNFNREEEIGRLLDQAYTELGKAYYEGGFVHQLGYQGYNIQQYLFAYREDKQSFQKRRFHFRINEAKLRYRNFKAMHLLFPLGWLYVIRPVVGGLIPPGIVALLKRGPRACDCRAGRSSRRRCRSIFYQTVPCSYSPFS